MRDVTLSRQELYQMVWKEPMTKLAKQYGLSDNGLRKVCIKMQIPLPKAGHWMKVQAGKKVIIPPLSSDYTGEQEVKLTVDKDGAFSEEGTVPSIQFLENELKNSLGDLLLVPARLNRPDELIILAKEHLERERKQYLREGLVRSSSGYLGIAVSPANLARALRFMDTLVKAIKARGHSVYADYNETRVLIEGEWMEIHIREKLDKFVVKEGRWDRTLYNPSGILVFQMKHIWAKEWYDGKMPLEERLPRILASLEHKCRKMHEESIERDRKRAEREERERVYRELENRQDQELDSFKTLLADAERWQKANMLREYAAGVERTAIGSDTLSDSLKEWLDWVRKKADWFDPQVKRHDALLTEVDWKTLSLSRKPSLLFW